MLYALIHKATTRNDITVHYTFPVATLLASDPINLVYLFFIELQIY